MHVVNKTRWAVLGTGAICKDFVRALGASNFGVLQAVGSSDRQRAGQFAAAYGAAHSGIYDDVLDRADIDAVYVGTVHVTHADLSKRALRAGKAVLCEKPMALSSVEAQSVMEVARQSERPFVEAYKYRFGPCFVALRSLLAAGEIGRVEALEVSFGFRAGSRTGRLFDPALAGGAIYDVGGYPISFAVAAATASGIDLTSATIDRASAFMTHGVDGRAHARIVIDDFTARIHASIIAPRTRAVRIRGSEGTVVLPDGWGNRACSASIIHVHRWRGHNHRTLEVPIINPMAAEANSTALALAESCLETPEMPWAESLLTSDLLERWRLHVLSLSRVAT